MIDFHCHFLPNMDDGAQDVQESICILKELERQGVNTVVATPHFYAENELIDEFVVRRNVAYNKVCEMYDGSLKIVLGAEVKVSPELLTTDFLEKLCIGNSRCILLEMPYSPWQQWMFDIFFKIEEMNIIPVLAHAERYYESDKLFKYRRFFELKRIYMQFNADSFLMMFGRRILKTFLEKEVCAIVGSDAHDMKKRKPHLEKAKKVIESRFEKDLLQKMESNAAELLTDNFSLNEN